MNMFVSHCGAPVTKHCQLELGSAGAVPVKQGTDALIAVISQITSNLESYGKWEILSNERKMQDSPLLLTSQSKTMSDAYSASYIKAAVIKAAPELRSGKLAFRLS